MKNNTLFTPYLLFSLSISFMAPMVIDIMSPSLPYIADFFRLTKSSAQLLITAAIFGLILGQVIAGMLSDAVGRGRMIYIGLTILAISSIFCTLATTIYWIFLARFFQGISASLIGVNNRALIREKFDDDQYLSALNYIVLAWRAFVVIGPMIGATLQYYIGWKAVFYFICLYALIVLSVYFIFVKDKIETQHGKNIHQNFSNFFFFFTKKDFILNIIALGLSIATGILFVQFSPFFILRHFHVNVLSIGMCNMSIGIAYIFSSIAIKFLNNSPVKIYWMSLFSISMGILCLVLFGKNNLKLFLLIIFVIQFGFGLSGPILLANALKSFKNNASSAAAAQGMILWTTCSIASLLFSFINNQSLAIYAMIIGCIAIFILIIWGGQLKRIKTS
ncbi:MAG: MFS transporter [Gammaproteobacteria bacterium]|nr:MFS transporter [Gammaproteobacteria bacterium]